MGEIRKSEPNKAKQVGGTIAKSIGLYYANYIDRLVSTGRYATVAEVLREALRLHEINHIEPKEVEND